MSTPTIMVVAIGVFGLGLLLYGILCWLTGGGRR